MKKVLFWITFVPFCILMVIFGIAARMGESLLSLSHRWEYWCFDYEKDGWKHIGDGIYTKY